MNSTKRTNLTKATKSPNNMLPSIKPAPQGNLTVPTKGVQPHNSPHESTKQSGTVPHDIVWESNYLSESEASPTLGVTPSERIASVHNEGPLGGLDTGNAKVYTPDSNTDEASILQGKTTRKQKNVSPAQTVTKDGTSNNGHNHPPPIILTTHGNFIHTAKLITKEAQSRARLAYTKTGGKRQPNSLEDYETCQKIIKSQGLLQYTYKARPLPSFTMVIRGFIPTIPEEEVAELLEEEGIPVNNIKQIKKKDNTDQNKLIAMPLLAVSVPMEQQDRLKNLSNIARVEVVTKPYRQDKKPLQYFKCQQFGHHSSCCGQEDHITQTIAHVMRTNPFRSNVQTAKEHILQATETVGTGRKNLTKQIYGEKNKNIHLTTAKNQQQIAPQLSASHVPELPPHHSNLMKQTEEKGLPLQSTDIEDPSPITETETMEAIKFLHTQEFRNAIKIILKINKEAEKHLDPAQKETAILMGLLEALNT
ncbi:hypothetical protein PR048_026449 [Dryococelus australis]|uniref:Uncharacterized protein n=1 Tax=Dryococelus australis TaxID=614101 RepID=A0ABQ9GLD0_9NEOP|nr:hypothetical protein PR048_026449 [Dryococelus australis]